jgi:hypothetical protein
MFREMSKKYFEPVSMWMMILGIVSIVQPWSMFFHLHGVIITLIGLVSFIFFSHIKSLPEKDSSKDIEENILRREERTVLKQAVIIGKSQDENTMEGISKAQGQEETESPEEKEKALSLALQGRE